MRILVTGGAGFIGSHIADAYLAEGHEVAIVDNLSTGRRSNVPEGAVLYEADIRDPRIVRVLSEFRPEVVSHHAAQASVKLGQADPVSDLEVNGGGTAQLLHAATSSGVHKVIYSSSGGTVYGEPASLPVSESFEIAPLSNYGTSKFVGELYVRLLARAAGMDFTIFRYGNAFGPRQDPAGEAGVVAIFAGLMLNKQTCTIDGDGEQKKDYVYVGDIVRANMMALDRGSGLVANIGTGVGISVNHIFEVLSAALNYDLPPVYGPPREGDVRNFWLDCSIARAQLGWEPRTTFEEGVRLTVAALV